LRKFFKSLKSFLGVEREIICITDHGILSKKIGIVFLLWNVSLIFWTFFITIKFFDLNKEFIEKEERIVYLESNQEKLLSNIALLDSEVVKVGDFLDSLNQYDRLASVKKTESYDVNKDIGDEVFVALDRTKRNVKRVNMAVLNRIKNLKSIKDKLMIGDDEPLELVAMKNDEYESSFFDNEVKESILLKKSLGKNIDNLQKLEGFVNDLPALEPLEYINISSHFGDRLDPFMRTTKKHYGVDLAGPYLSRIYAPADGEVIFAGVRGGYGNALIIEHKNNIKTLYGHLSTITARLGQKVKRGDIIGVQGSTGRATGEHLHYEIIRERDARYDPIEMMNIGHKLY
jgi:murein DD-endopeptidase MepM/ murein hydrolase activator NlpD